MAYRALYRKWRPVDFDTIIGQGHIVDTLRNEILSSHLAHAYLFTGTRGTGKTSTAKILSRAVNCESPINGNPCNECECCRNILNELSLDVMEIDAASNTGVDNIRDIIEQLQYRPSMGNYKVYIIDEVHMLSTGAFNALLKTLEEPPSHVMFILATTEVQKIPATILSRCQRFDFKTISIADIVNNLQKILIAEGINAEYDALEYVAFLGDGSMRDSLSILDQCLAFKSDNLTLSDITDIVGAIDDAMLYDFASDIASCDLTSALTRFNECINSGKNFDNIIKGLMQVMREILMYKINKDSFSVSRLKAGLLNKCADKFDTSSLVRYIGILTDTVSALKNITSQRVVCECALVKLTTPKVNTDFESLLSRIDSLESRLALYEKNPPVSKTPAPGTQTDFAPEAMDADMISLSEYIPPLEESAYDMPDIPKEADISDNTSSGESSEVVSSGRVSFVINNWADVLSELTKESKFRVYTALMDARLSSEGCKLVINTGDEDNKRFLSEKTNTIAIKDALKAVSGEEIDILIINDTVIFNDSEDDIFQNLDNMGKNFPSNFNID